MKAGAVIVSFPNPVRPGGVLVPRQSTFDYNDGRRIAIRRPSKIAYPIFLPNAFLMRLV